ncbi:MAG TPA: SRPBCC family protein [Cryptosporangiaceae bacterium]|nr:SRPBCC family protein [Cryptosporangiaceae bacterium]
MEAAPPTDRGPGELTVPGLVRAPIEVAFAVATDWERQSRWIPLTRVRVVEGDGRSAGSVVHAFTGIGRIGFLDVLRITRWDPPRRVDVLHVGRLVRGPAEFTFAADGPDRTRFVWAEYLHLPLGRPGVWAWRLVRPLAAAAFRVALRRFGRMAEQAQTPATG